MRKRLERGYGWRPDLPDHRDHRFAPASSARLPAAVSLRERMPPVLNQGSLGSCTAHAAATAFGFLRPGFDLSRLKTYFEARALIGMERVDSGAYIRDAIKVLNKLGAAPEATWPYIVAKFATKPPRRVVNAGKKNKVTSYARLSPSQYRRCLADGFPFVIGFTVYESFESASVARTGRVRMPGRNEAVVGGHAVTVIGYATKWGERHYEVRNSWGASWGDAGNFWMPAAYLENLNLADDAWTIRAA